VLVSLSQRIQQLPVESRWAIERFYASDGGTILATLIQQESCIAVSDGSFKDQHGTASWVMEAETSCGRILGDCVTPGNPSDQSAYRSE
jgi:hypothetical protein